jgi:hypothetical protein
MGSTLNESSPGMEYMSTKDNNDQVPTPRLKEGNHSRQAPRSRLRIAEAIKTVLQYPRIGRLTRIQSLIEAERQPAERGVEFHGELISSLKVEKPQNSYNFLHGHGLVVTYLQEREVEYREARYLRRQTRSESIKLKSLELKLWRRR